MLFIIVLMISVLTLALAAAGLLSGRVSLARSLLAAWAIGICVYLAAIVLVSLGSPQRVIAVGEDHCFDDWCIAVESVTRLEGLGSGELAAETGAVYYAVTLRLSNRARGRAQSAGSAAVHLFDAQGRRHDLSPRGQAAYEIRYGTVRPLTVAIPVGQTEATVQVFELPESAVPTALTVEHPVGFSPSLLIIGDEASLFHKPTIVRLP